MNKEALGLVEVYGYLGAIEAADVALKSANVKLIGCEFVTGGLVTVQIEGDVSAVQASIDAAKVAVDRLGGLVSTHVIPKPTQETWEMLTGENLQNKKEETTVSELSKNIEVINTTEVSEDAPKIVKENIKIETEEKLLELGSTINESIEDSFINKNLNDICNELQGKTVLELRKLARNLKITSMTNKQIKFARKDTLIEEIKSFYERGDN